jgi:hypothetical protein
MARAEGKAFMKLEVTLYLDETEVRYLNAMAGYSDSALNSALETVTGKNKHQAGFYSFLAMCRAELGETIRKLDAARKVFEGDK